MASEKYLSYVVDGVNKAETIRVTRYKKSFRIYIKNPRGTAITFHLHFPWETLKTDAPELWAVFDTKEYELNDRRTRPKKVAN